MQMSYPAQCTLLPAHLLASYSMLSQFWPLFAVNDITAIFYILHYTYVKTGKETAQNRFSHHIHDRQMEIKSHRILPFWKPNPELLIA